MTRTYPSVEKCSGTGFSLLQCCGAGSGIRCLFDPRIRDPVWVKSQDPYPGSCMAIKSGSGSGIQDQQPGSYFLRNHFWVKILKFFDADLGSGMEKSRIRDPEKHPGSATLHYWLS